MKRRLRASQRSSESSKNWNSTTLQDLKCAEKWRKKVQTRLTFVHMATKSSQLPSPSMDQQQRGVHKYATWKYFYGMKLIFRCLDSFDKLLKSKSWIVRTFGYVDNLFPPSNHLELQANVNEKWKMCFHSIFSECMASHLFWTIFTPNKIRHEKIKQFLICFRLWYLSVRWIGAWSAVSCESQRRDLNLCVWCYQSAKPAGAKSRMNSKKK